MYAKIEPSGCCERKGQVQIRISMYLEKDDYGYEKHYIQVTDFTNAVYKGEVDKNGVPIDLKDYQAWIDSLPKIWQNNPFHNHFIQVIPDISNAEIEEISKAFLEECYIKWAQDFSLVSKEYQPRNDALPFVKPSIVTDTLQLACNVKVASVKGITKEIRL